MADISSSSTSHGVAFLVSAGLVYEAIAAACSSPQTMEINAKARASTLMKWVHIGVAQGGFLVLAAAWFDPKHRFAILSGGTIAGGLMYLQYRHAKESGLKSNKPGTEG